MKLSLASCKHPPIFLVCMIRDFCSNFAKWSCFLPLSKFHGDSWSKFLSWNILRLVSGLYSNLVRRGNCPVSMIGKWCHIGVINSRSLWKVVRAPRVLRNHGVFKILAVDFITIVNQQFVKIRTDRDDINQVARKVCSRNNALRLYMSYSAPWLDINLNWIKIATRLLSALKTTSTWTG